MANHGLPPSEPPLSGSHHLFWLDSHALILALAIYLTYTVYLLATCIWLYIQRRHYLFRKTPLCVTLGSAIMQWLMGTTHIWSYSSITNLPGTLVIWRNYVFFPLCIVYSVHARGMHILFEVIWTKSIGHPALGGHQRRAADTFWQGCKKRAKDPHLHVWLKNKGSYIMVLAMSVMHFLVACILTYYFGGQTLTTSAAVATAWFTVETGGVIISILIYVVIWCPIMLHYLTDVKDAYGLRRDLKVGMSYALPCYLLYTSFRSYGFLQNLRVEIPSFLFLMASVFALHTSSVTAPLIRTLFWVPEELDPSLDRPVNTVPEHVVIPYKPIPLEIVLSNPVLREPFEAYSRNAFVWDSVLFHYAVTEFRQRVTMAPWEIHWEAQRIYEQYIEYGSPCEMTLPFVVVETIRSLLVSGKLWVGMFDEAQVETLRLVGNCTYRNFLFTLAPAEKARYMLPHGHFIHSESLH